MKRSIREALFFTLAFLLFFIVVKIVRYWIKSKNLKSDIGYSVGAAVFTLILVGIYFLASLNTSKESFWDVSSAALCKGGPYMWQGNDEVSKMCREMASTPEGQVAISGYNCPTGYKGAPGLPFIYSPLSNDSWQNARCEDIPTCDHIDVGLCSLQKQIP